MSIGKILVLGGARSGKSRFALQLCKDAAARAFLATAQAFDDEMKQRIDLHINERKNLGFANFEEPIDVTLKMQSIAQQGYHTVILDCLSLWISNLLLADLSDDVISEKLKTFVDWIQHSSSSYVMVGNEVGLGIVPDNRLARRFRDLNGRLHQDLSAVCDECYYAVAGNAVPLKRLGQPIQ